MFTSIDKALTALIFSVIYLLNTFFNAGLVVSPDLVALIVTVIAPIAVWAVPNKK